MSEIKDMGTFVMLADGHMIPQSKVKAHNQRVAQSMDEQRQKERERAAAAPKYSCPLKGGLYKTCSLERCAFFANQDCVLHRLADGIIVGTGTEDRNRKMCPFRAGEVCSSTCVLRTGETCGIVAALENKVF